MHVCGCACASCVGMSAARASLSSPHTQSSVGTDGKGSHCQSRQRDGVLLTTDLSLLLLPCLPPAFTAPAHLVVQLLELLVIALLRIHLNLHCIHLQQLRTLLWVLTAILTLAGPGRVLFGMGVRVLQDGVQGVGSKAGQARVGRLKCLPPVLVLQGMHAQAPHAVAPTGAAIHPITVRAIGGYGNNNALRKQTTPSDQNCPLPPLILAACLSHAARTCAGRAACVPCDHTPLHVPTGAPA